MPGAGDFVAAVQPVVDAIRAAPTAAETAVNNSVDAATRDARAVGDAIVAGIGDALETIGITEDDLKQLSPFQQSAVSELSRVTGELRTALDTLRGMVPAIEAVVRKPLFEKFAPENTRVILEAAQQAQRLLVAILAVFSKIKPLIAPWQPLVDSVRTRFAGYYDVAQ